MSTKTEEIRESLKSLSLLEASELVKQIEEAFGVSAAASAGVVMAAPGAAITTPAEAAADTPKASSICFTSSDASKSDRDFNDSRISSVFADIFLKVN